MERLDKRAPFTATGGIIPPEFQNIKTPCYILDEKALTENAKLLGEVAERTGCKMLLAQKAFSNYDCYPFFEPYLAGTEASGLYEARLGAEEMAGKKFMYSVQGTGRMNSRNFFSMPIILYLILRPSFFALEEWRKRQEKAWDSGSIRNALPRRDMRFMTLVHREAAWVQQEYSGMKQL